MKYSLPFFLIHVLLQMTPVPLTRLSVLCAVLTRLVHSVLCAEVCTTNLSNVYVDIIETASCSVR